MIQMQVISSKAALNEGGEVFDLAMAERVFGSAGFDDMRTEI